uniref:R-phycoerythrin gamma-1 chain, chloroplastic (Fragments) n=1 Tax=Gastroclonium coulteri TaxID=2773 RepID=PHEG1_GASCO|nr:RecName: Full=R-phycoerythrin gamma-1 chain, chloroplastic [Gastroclonium coulteri]
SGYSGAALDFPVAPSLAGHYSLTNCGQPSGASKCAEGTVPQAAFEKGTCYRELYASSCHHEETQIFQYPAV